MRISFRRALAATPEQVTLALLDAEALRGCIPGCEELRPLGEGDYEMVVAVGLPGLKGRYTGRVRAEERDDSTIALSGEGKGAPGFVRGRAVVALLPSGGGTDLSLDAEVQVGGVLAGVASRLVPPTAKKMTDEFLDRLAARLETDNRDARSPEAANAALEDL